MTDKRKPIAERIAELFGKTAYRDVRDGIGGGFSLSVPVVAAQLGMIQQTRGETVVKIMETYYGSTLIHERDIRRAWESHCRSIVVNPDHETSVLSRMGCALAIRQFAGMDYTPSAIEDYAWIIRQRKESLRVAIMFAEDWMDELWQTGLRDLRDAFRAIAA